MKKILVEFIGRAGYIEYTDRILSLLKTDPAVKTIIDSETGEILYSK